MIAFIVNIAGELCWLILVPFFTMSKAASLNVSQLVSPLHVYKR